MFNMVIDHTICDEDKCLECLDICPMEIFIVENHQVMISDIDSCSHCEVCMDICPKNAITITYD